MEISLVGMDHRFAPVEVREQLYLEPEAACRLLRAARAEGLFEEGLVLSTCNRTELYFVDPQGRFDLVHLLRHVASLKGTAPIEDLSPFHCRDGRDAVEHLLRVACGLESQVIGEHEILGQLKAAFRVARRAGTARFLLGRLMHQAFRTGKQARAETALGEGCTGVPGAAIALAAGVLGSLEGRSVLLIGAGRAAELAALSLLRSGAGALLIANRTRAHSEEVACRLHEMLRAEQSEADDSSCPARRAQRGQCGLAPQAQEGSSRAAISVVEFGDVASLAPMVDLVISSTGAPGYVLTAEMIGSSLQRHGPPLVIVDIAVPRDVDPAVAQAGNVRLYNIDDLDRLVQQGLLARQEAVPQAELIALQGADRFCRWRDRLQAVPTIKLLRRRIEELRKAELERRRGQFRQADWETLDLFSRSLCKKFAHMPLAYLQRTAAEDSAGSRMQVLDLIRGMFDLDSGEGDQCST